MSDARGCFATSAMLHDHLVEVLRLHDIGKRIDGLCDERKLAMLAWLGVGAVRDKGGFAVLDAWEYAEKAEARAVAAEMKP